MISSLYIVSPDGRPIYNYEAESNEFNAGIVEATLFSGIVTAIQSVMKEINAGQISNFNTEKNKIYIKSRNNLVYVVMTPLISNLTQDQVDLFFDKIIENIPLDVTDSVISISSKENMMMNNVVKMLYDQWLLQVKESKASKKLKEDLW